MPKVGIVMGSISDFEVVKKAIEVLKEFNIEVEAAGYCLPIVHLMTQQNMPGQLREEG